MRGLIQRWKALPTGTKWLVFLGAGTLLVTFLIWRQKQASAASQASTASTGQDTSNQDTSGQTPPPPGTTPPPPAPAIDPYAFYTPPAPLPPGQQPPAPLPPASQPPAPAPQPPMPIAPGRMPPVKAPSFAASSHAAGMGGDLASYAGSGATPNAPAAAVPDRPVAITPWLSTADE